jgi:hypothetical protein
MFQLKVKSIKPEAEFLFRRVRDFILNVDIETSETVSDIAKSIELFQDLQIDPKSLFVDLLFLAEIKSFADETQ